MKTKKYTEIAYLSIREPWAGLILEGYKDVENRDWEWAHRGELLIHAGKSLVDFENGRKRALSIGKVKVPPKEDLTFGAFVGIVDLIDCVEESKSKWFFGEYGLVLANPRRIKPIPGHAQQTKGQGHHGRASLVIGRFGRPIDS